jgi:hypothetical protein
VVKQDVTADLRVGAKLREVQSALAARPSSSVIPCTSLQAERSRAGDSRSPHHVAVLDRSGPGRVPSCWRFGPSVSTRSARALAEVPFMGAPSSAREASRMPGRPVSQAPRHIPRLRPPKRRSQ